MSTRAPLPSDIKFADGVPADEHTGPIYRLPHSIEIDPFGQGKSPLIATERWSLGRDSTGWALTVDGTFQNLATIASRFFSNREEALKKLRRDLVDTAFNLK